MKFTRYHIELAYANKIRDLSEAYLYGADLYGADLSRAKLDIKDVSINSHELIAEILKQSTDKIKFLQVVGMILLQKHWCWNDFIQKYLVTLSNKKEIFDWIYSVLEKWENVKTRLDKYKEEIYE